MCVTYWSKFLVLENKDSQYQEWDFVSGTVLMQQ